MNLNVRHYIDENIRHDYLIYVDDVRGISDAKRCSSVRMSGGEWVSVKTIHVDAGDIPEDVVFRAQGIYKRKVGLHRLWKSINTAPTDGTPFDAWCVAPNSPYTGVRIPCVKMRADGSGFGYILHGDRKAVWQYLDAREEDPMPKWIPTHWMEIPRGPH